MNISLDNIGKIEKATIEIKGITVIAGENNTGKSTVGKTLYAIFNSFYQIQNKLKKERLQAIERIIVEITSTNSPSGDFFKDFERIRETSFGVFDIFNKEDLIEESLENKIKSLEEITSDLNVEEPKDENIRKMANKIHDIMKISDNEILKNILTKNLSLEFDGQINNIYEEDKGYISLDIKASKVSIEVENDEVVLLSNNYDLNTEAIYLDDPFVLDEYINPNPRFFQINSYYDHETNLMIKLSQNLQGGSALNEIMNKNKLDSIYSKLDKVCDGEISSLKGRWGYSEKGSDKVLNMRNVSSGLKTFVILKRLIQNGTINDNGTIILDEPEIHLHPKWQLMFAELIVLIQKEFDMHILINTHSPYFLNAIEVYSKKYEIEDKCKYYLSRLDGEKAVIDDVTDNTELIYEKLARPLQILETEMAKYD